MRNKFQVSTEKLREKKVKATRKKYKYKDIEKENTRQVLGQVGLVLANHFRC